MCFVGSVLALSLTVGMFTFGRNADIACGVSQPARSVPMCLAGLQLHAPDAVTGVRVKDSIQPAAAPELSTIESALQEDSTDQTCPDYLSTMLVYMAQVPSAGLIDQSGDSHPPDQSTTCSRGEIQQECAPSATLMHTYRQSRHQMQDDCHFPCTAGMPCTLALWHAAS